MTEANSQSACDRSDQTLEPGIHEGNVQQLPAVFRLLYPHPIAAAISRLGVPGRQGHDRSGTLGLCSGHTADTPVQRLHRRQFQPQAGTDGVLLCLFHLFRRIYRSRHTADVRNSAHHARNPVRSRHSGQQHRGHRRAAVVAPQRGHRLLRSEQQRSHGHSSVGRHLHLLGHRQFRIAVLDRACARHGRDSYARRGYGSPSANSWPASRNSASTTFSSAGHGSWPSI